MTTKNQPLVSVIITTYHNEEYLPRAIECVLHQSYSNIELIVVDDNPPGTEARAKTEAVMADYPDVIYIRHPENRNGAAARNTGIRAAKGEYIAFLDNDDIYFSNHIADCVADALAHPECKCILSGVVKIQSGMCWDIISPIADEPVKSLLLHETALGTGSNLFVQADAVREIQGFDERFRRHQDVEFGIRLFSLYPVHNLSKVDIVKEMDGFSNAPDFQRFLDTKRFFWDVFQEEISSLTPEEQKQYYAGQYSSLLYTACRSGNSLYRKETVSRLKEYRPLRPKEYLLILLSCFRLFPIYEKLKKGFKKRKTASLYKTVTAHLSAYDLDVFNQALSKTTKE